MPQERLCRVSFVDKNSVGHFVEVTAYSVFEAAALALKAFSAHELKIPSKRTLIKVEVLSSVQVSHAVTIEKIERWIRNDFGVTDSERFEKLKLIYTLESQAGWSRR